MSVERIFLFPFLIQTVCCIGTCLSAIMGTVRTEQGRVNMNILGRFVRSVCLDL